MLKVVEKRDEREAGEEVLLLDEIARRGAVRMLIEALNRRKPTLTSSAMAASATSRATRWWCATAGPGRASSRSARGPWSCKRHEWRSR